MIVVANPLLILLGGLFFFVFVVPYWWLHYGPEGQSIRGWVPGLLVIAACIGAIFLWAALRA